MIEQDAVIGTLIGFVTGLVPTVVMLVWRLCQARQMQKERQAEREHILEMQRLSNQRHATAIGLQKFYEVNLSNNSATYRPPAGNSQG